MKYIYFVHRTKVRPKSQPIRTEYLLFQFSPVLQDCLTYAKHASNRYKLAYGVSRREYNAFGECVALRAIAVYNKGIRVFEDKQFQFEEAKDDVI